ncbi:hypothetical protein PPSIR1_11165 [Plesiocystis pacifica SIR-1]|uniref:SnoaL-like domain-containing protein n=1 Tax=Plesiocystis pacifica SIR-1 TaxID=391625 RepID=A6G136_9BACT|nr:hypothetical protein [Plesiocystis pacifica]EDM80331.1 hypothetical protein PPSIR1_11165 [Plesiocystis pacifica SIR-1]
MADDPPPAVPPADPHDVDSIDGIVNALYDSVSFAEGERPTWERFRSLFQPSAVMVRVNPRVTREVAARSGSWGRPATSETGADEGGASPHSDDQPEALRVSSIDDYIARTTAAIEGGALRGFTERELTRRTEVFADVAQVFSTYERSAEAEGVRRGVNSMAMVKDGERWWIVSLSWTDETDDGPLPSRYQPRS